MKKQPFCGKNGGSADNSKISAGLTDNCKISDLFEEFLFWMEKTEGIDPCSDEEL